MPHPKFQLYKHIKISGRWRYCRAAIYSNGKVKPQVIVVVGQEEKHEEGSYCQTSRLAHGHPCLAGVAL